MFSLYGNGCAGGVIRSADGSALEGVVDFLHQAEIAFPQVDACHDAGGGAKQVILAQVRKIIVHTGPGKSEASLDPDPDLALNCESTEDQGQQEQVFFHGIGF